MESEIKKMMKDFFKDEMIENEIIDDVVISNEIIDDEIIVREAPLEDAIKVHREVPEFEVEGLESDDDLKSYFEDRYKDKEKVIIVGYLNEKPIGYLIGYDRDEDGDSFYCWMAGVSSQWRRIGTLTGLMYYQKEWAKKHGYKTLKIKTRNTRREMLSYLVKEGFNFTNVDTRDTIEDNRISLQISL